jgi:predicted dehydrogenase/threonine dehydrogenase-like Zn-dependent dehydrogenase
MRQILQNLKTGEMEVVDLPCPGAGRGQVLIQTRASLISAGTERMLVEFSQANLIQKARQQPDRVKQVLDKIRTDGLLPTLETVFRKLDEPLPLGYCSSGVVLEVGPGVHDIHPGDRVASNGPHAEIVCVPRNLCAKIPDGVSDEHAAFTVLGSIALEGVRIAAPTLGEKFMVFGMGMIGLLAVQFLQASGCQTLAVDLNAKRLALAERFGAKTLNVSQGGDPVAAAQAWTGGRGVDGVLLCAAAPKNDEIIHQAAESCRQRGRVILVGVVGLNLRRDDFYKKGIAFQLSTSYGPGRYDEAYEQKGQDYPLPFVRWTEQRNFEAVLETLRSGRLSVEPLITDRFELAQAPAAYDKIQHAPDSLGVLLQYPGEVNRAPRVVISRQASAAPAQASVGVIGAGGFAKGVLLPALAKTPCKVVRIADLNAAAARHAASRFGAGEAVTDYKMILDDPSINAVFVVVGHSLHARFVCEALAARKHVFVEKPLAINEEQLAAVTEAVAKAPDRLLMVGFNRGFSLHTTKIRQVLAGRSEPLCMNMTVNAGAIPPEHWIQDPEVGGGRIIGEGCHFIDLLTSIAASKVKSVSAMMVGEGTAVREDKMSILLWFEDGSIGTVHYFSNGSKSYPKETLEVFSDGRVLRMENFRRTLGYGFRGFRKFGTFRQDKGHNAEMAAFIARVMAGGEPLIPFDRLANTTRATFAAVESARTGKTITL